MKAGIGFLAGMGVGVALGLMFAPQSGIETQDLIAQRAGSSFDRASAAARNLRRRAEDVVDEARERTAEAFEKTKEAYREATGAT